MEPVPAKRLDDRGQSSDTSPLHLTAWMVPKEPKVTPKIHSTRCVPTVHNRLFASTAIRGKPSAGKLDPEKLRQVFLWSRLNEVPSTRLVTSRQLPSLGTWTGFNVSTDGHFGWTADVLPLRWALVFVSWERAWTSPDCCANASRPIQGVEHLPFRCAVKAPLPVVRAGGTVAPASTTSHRADRPSCRRVPGGATGVGVGQRNSETPGSGGNWCGGLNCET